MNFREWLSTVPDVITGDALWTLEAYRLSLFAAELGWFDCTKLMQDRRTLSLSDQLFRAMGSVGANISEGYSRSSGKDRTRFYEYSLGSSRESRHWYYEGRHVLGEPVVAHRLSLQTQITRLLLTMIPDQRGFALGEAPVHYGKYSADVSADLNEFINEVPLP